MQTMINVQNLTFDYPDKRALHDVSCTIRKGAITALVGPNGAGKTTLMRCISGLEEVLQGDITVGDHNIRQAPREIHRILSYLPDNFGIFEDLTVWQCLLYGAWSRDIAQGEAPRVAEKIIEMLHLGPFRDKKASELSRGWRQRLGIGLAIIHEPAVLMLDEPAAGLDPEARAELSALLKLLQVRGTTIVVSSHILAELEEYCTDMLIIQNGRLVEHADLNDLTKAQTLDLHVRALNWSDAYKDQLKLAAGVSQMQKEEMGIVSCQFTGTETDAAALLRRLVESGLQVSTFTAAQQSMQDLYLKSTREMKQPAIKPPAQTDIPAKPAPAAKDDAK